MKKIKSLLISCALFGACGCNQVVNNSNEKQKIEDKQINIDEDKQKIETGDSPNVQSNDETEQENNNKETQKYHLSIDGASYMEQTVISAGDYEAGHEFEFELPIACDFGVFVYLERTHVASYKSENGYDFYKFTMPDHDAQLVLTSDAFYLDDGIFSLSRLGNGVMADTIESVVLTKGYNGVDETENPPTVVKSKAKEDIEFFCNFLKEKIFTRGNYDYLEPGGWYIEIKYLNSFDNCVNLVRIDNNIFTIVSFSDGPQYFECKVDLREYLQILYPVGTRR